MVEDTTGPQIIAAGVRGRRAPEENGVMVEDTTGPQTIAPPEGSRY
jgi:hypothetical protein